jgi:alanine racemase
MNVTSRPVDSSPRSAPESVDEAPNSARERRTGEKVELRVRKPRRAAPADAVRPTRAEVNLEALRHNLRLVKRHAGEARVWAVMKADGYGHGAPAVARTLERAGADGFCVALLEEGVELREAGIVAPILVMGGYYGGAHAELVARRLTPVIYDLAQLEGFARVARNLGTERVDVHLKIDTGMARLGVTLA